MDGYGLNGSIKKNQKQNGMEDGCPCMGAPTAFKGHGDDDDDDEVSLNSIL